METNNNNSNSNNNNDHQTESLTDEKVDKIIKMITLAPTSFLGNKPQDDQTTREENIAYIASMYKKAKTHSAKVYEFFVNGGNNNNTNNEEIFTTPIQVDFSELVSKAINVDRKLDCKPDIRCKGLNPTRLQRQIMDSIDANNCTMVKAPSSSGKTLLSLYLVKRTQVVKKKITLYVASNKPLCNEFALFAVKQKFNFAIGTEDFFNWEDVVKADVVICTPPILLKLIFISDLHFNFLERIGSVIFDELPNTLVNHNEIMPFILLLSSSMKWQCLTLSATLNAELKNILHILFPNIDYLEPQEAIRPTDLVIRNMNGLELELLPTSSIYTPKLLQSNETVKRALQLPIALNEFKSLYSQLNPNSTVHDELTKNIVSSNGELKGIGITEFAAKYSQHLRANDPTWDTTRDSKMEQLFLKKEPTAKELFILMRQLGKKNCLPVMFFHSNKNNLDKYHKEVSDIVIKLVEKGTTNKKIPKYSEKDMLPDDDVGYKKWVNPFGFLGEDELAEIFKHRPANDGKNKFKLGFRGRKVQTSSYYHGIQQGIGIHHHDVEKPVRDAVESGLRMGYLRAVFCDYTMALGLNMPVKTVVFIGGKEETINSDDFIQASGRAGRWGMDTSGSIMFIGHSASQVKNIWNPSSLSASCKFPISELLLLSIVTGPNIIKSFLPNWLQISIPQWNWTPETAKREIALKFIKLKQMSAVKTNNELSLIGEIDLALQDEGELSFIIGYIFLKYGKDFQNLIKTQKEYLFVCSHFLKPWRATLENAPTLSSVRISDDIRNLMSKIYTDVVGTFGSSCITPTDKITSLYVVYPNLTEFTSKGYSTSMLKSLMAHFMSKMKNLQRKAKLPYGDDVLQHYENNN